MGLHNLESESVLDIIKAFEGDTEVSGTISTIHQIFETYGSVPNAPLSTQAELAAHLLTFIRGWRFSSARRQAMRKLEVLNKVIERHKDTRLGIFIELVDLSSFQETMARYTVWKGVLFDLQLDQPVVCWHPDKDFKPINPIHIHRTGYSELGRCQRYRNTRMPTA
jgi:hypothetical protein